MPKQTLINRSQVKNFIRDQEQHVQVADEFYDELEQQLKQTIEKALRRARQNARSTVMARDV